MFDGRYNFFRILRVKADGYGVDAAKFFKQHAFALHDGHGRKRADIAKSKNGAAVGYDGDGIGFYRVSVRFRGILGNDSAWLSNAGSIGDGERVAVFYR